MEYVQFSAAKEGLLSKMSRFLKGCAPYDVTAPGYSIMYATGNVYKALGRANFLRKLSDLPSNTALGYSRRRDTLFNILGVGSTQKLGFTTLYEDGREGHNGGIRSVPRHLARGMCCIMSALATAVCFVATLVMSAVAFVMCVALLPIVPVAFLVCATIAIEHNVISHVSAVFQSVKKDISDSIKKHLSVDRTKKAEESMCVADTRGGLGVTAGSGTFGGKCAEFVASSLGGAIAAAGKVVTLAVLVPVFALLAPISFMMAATTFMLSLCSLERHTINRNVEKMGAYAIHDFLPITQQVRSTSYDSITDEAVESKGSGFSSYYDSPDDLDSFLTWEAKIKTRGPIHQHSPRII